MISKNPESEETKLSTGNKQGILATHASNQGGALTTIKRAARMNVDLVVILMTNTTSRQSL